VARLSGEPLGAATIAVDPQGRASRERLGAALYRGLHAELRDAFARRGAPFPSSLPLDGVPRLPYEDRRKRGPRRSISVVVTVRADPVALERCLRSIIDCDYDPLEVIVVENRRGVAATRRLLAERCDSLSRLRYVEESRRGLSHARNAGLAVADGEIVAFTSDDVAVDPGWLRRCAEEFERADDVACVTGLILPRELPTERQLALERCAGFGRGLRPQIYRRRERGEGPPRFPYTTCPTGLAANTAVRSDVVRRSGWFDVSLGAGTPTARGEDLDLSIRLLHAGHAIAYHPGLIVWHANGDGHAQPRREAYRYGVGVGAVRAKQWLAGGERFGVLEGSPTATGHAPDPISVGSSSERARLPAHLQSIKRIGMGVGPAAYVLSRLAQHTPRCPPRLAGGTVGGRRTPVELRLRSGGPPVELVTFREGDVARPPSAPGWRRRETRAIGDNSAVVGDGAVAQPLPSVVRPWAPTAVRSAAVSWGAAPALALIAAVGLALVAGADALSRSGAGDGRPFFWAGVMAVIVPIAYRMASEDVRRGERVALLAVFGLGLYGVKFLRDPFAFTYADELVHVANVDAILRTGHLLTDNSILPVTPLYPGLESVTAALASLTGLSQFAAGVVIIGVGRVLLTLGLYLFVETLTGSARTGGLAALLYAAAPNYIFFIGQYSYESLALPFAALVLFAFARCLRAAEAGDSFRWGVVALLLTAAVVVTHHMTTYALLAVLVAASALSTVLPGVRSRRAPWLIAGGASAMAALWLVSVARPTYGYLAPVIKGAITATSDTLSGELATRTLFRPNTGPSPPFWEHGVGVGSVVVLMLLMPFGLWTVWSRFRRSPIILALTAAGMLYGATLPLRLVPRAWETASRASEFLFVGVAVVVALAGVERWGKNRAPWPGRALVAAVAAVVIGGGIIAGSPSAHRLAESYRIDHGHRAIEPEGTDAARWAGTKLGHGNRFAAEQSDARLLQAYGRQFAIAGVYPDVEDVLHARTLEPWMLQLLREQRFRYVAVDSLRVSAGAGLYFFSPPGAWSATLFPSAVVDKLDRETNAVRVYDSGHIVIYDIRDLAYARAPH
jgi:GT2 family glycosyltransferase